jgi:AAA family ATP:ADP antiporter
LRECFIGSTYSELFSAVNLTGFLLQMFVVSRAVKFLGVGKALFVFMYWLKVADNSLDYSLGNTTEQALWLPTSREAKYKAKQAVDSFFMRAGDVVQAGFVFGGERLALSVPGFAGLNVILVGLWLTIAGIINLNLRRKKQPGCTDM